MEIEKYLKDLGSRNNGDVYLGVVGPVRVGKSTFIRRFMEVCVLEHIVDENEKEEQLMNYLQQEMVKQSLLLNQNLFRQMQ